MNQIIDEWKEIKGEVEALHPLMKNKIEAMEVSIDKAVQAVSTGELETIIFAIDAHHLCTELLGDAQHLRAVGIMIEDTFSRFTALMKAYCTEAFLKILVEFIARLRQETPEQIMVNLAQRASELDPRLQRMLVKFALKVREIGRSEGPVKVEESPAGEVNERG